MKEKQLPNVYFLNPTKKMSGTYSKSGKTIFPKSKIGYKTKANRPKRETIIVFYDGIKNNENKLWFIQIGVIRSEILKKYIHPDTHTHTHTHRHTHTHTHSDIRTYSKNGGFWFLACQNILLR